MFCILIAAAGVRAADATGDMVGTVTDPSGAVVPMAKVRLENPTTGAERVTVTGSLGEYSVPLLPPGTYTLSIEKQGFRTSSLENIQLSVDQTARLDVQLALGQMSENVVVEGAAPLVETDTAKVGYVIDERDVQGLPLNQRNFLEFALIVPGAQMPADGSQNALTGGAFSINGAREQSNNFLLDGTDNNDPLVNQYGTLPPLEGIEEFKVQTSDSTAEFGRTAGAQINIVLKSGTNSFHGSAFEFVRNRHLDAKNYFDLPDCRPGSVPGTCADIPALDRSQFGGSLGGPIQRNKTFFFLAYEGLQLREASTRGATVPSQVERNTALAAVPPAMQSAAGIAALNLYPAANVGTNLLTSNAFVSAPLSHARANQGLGKLDHQLTKRDALAAHYAVFDQNGYTAFDRYFLFTNLPGFGDNSSFHGDNAGLSWTRTGTSFTNEARFGFSRRHTQYLQQGSGNPLDRIPGFPDISTNPVDFGYPNIVVAGFDGIGTSIVLPQDFVSNTFEYADNAAWNPAFNGGRHRFKFGAQVRRVQENFFLDALKRGEWLFLGTFTGSSLTDLVAGLPTVAVATEGDSHTGLRATGMGYYFEDNLRATPNLTVTAALRYDLNLPATDIHDRLSVPDLSSKSATCTPKPDCQFIVAGTNGIPRATYRGNRNDFGPRLGFAWRPLSSNNLVVRGAYGIYYDTGILNMNLLPRSNPPFFRVNEYANFGGSNIQDIIQSGGALPVPVQSVRISPDFRDAYMQQWHLTVENQFGSNLAASVAYVGSRGVHLLDQREGNQPLPGGPAPYPQFGEIRYIASDGMSYYNSLQLQAQKRYTKSLSFRAAYTWSRSIDDSSSLFGSNAAPPFPQNSYDLRAERGLSDFQAAHRFVFSPVYNLPVKLASGGTKGDRLLNAVFGAWQVSGLLTLQTGHPFTVNRGVDQSHTDVSIGFFDRPDQIADPLQPGPVMSNPDASCHATISQGGRAADVVQSPSSWFNACAFAAPATPRFGTAGRNTVIGPGFSNIDFELAKSFNLGSENRRLQFRFQGFNILNHPNFDLPNGNFDSPSFTQVLSADAYGNKPSRQIQIGMRFVF